MEPSRDDLLRLLDLQKVDSTIDRLAARRRNLPEQAELDAAEEKLVALDREIAEQQAVAHEVALRQRKLDGEIEMLGQKAKSEEAKLYSGSIANPKELEDLRREIEAIRRRISGLEDQDLEVMEEREEADGRLQQLLDERAQLRETAAEAAGRRDRASREIEGQLAEARARREELGPAVELGLLELYEDIRALKDGVAAAALVDGVCQGCHMTLPAQEVYRIRHTEGLVRCDECRRILVVL